MKIVSVVGARPQFIKASVLCSLLREKHTEILVHTGQHYDTQMSPIFFDELGIPPPDYNLEVGSDHHGRQTGKMLIAIEKVLEKEKPDGVVVYGDTNSTLAGALSAVKMNIPVAHVEAGLRSFNRTMPEEHNRVLTDHCSDILFCPTETAQTNLKNEGIHRGIHLVGDIMYDALLHYRSVAKKHSTILDKLNLTPGSYLLTTIHRPHNTDATDRLQTILDILTDIDEPVIFPVHPRTNKTISKLQQKKLKNSQVQLIPPVGYLDMLTLEKHARKILTDSGGVQKEAFFFTVPCITLRTETEWVETVDSGWNETVGIDRKKVLKAVRRKPSTKTTNAKQYFGKGKAAQKIVKILEKSF